MEFVFNLDCNLIVKLTFGNDRADSDFEMMSVFES